MDLRSDAYPAARRGAGHGAARPLDERALAVWPRLDRRKLRRCAGDPTRIVDLISQRTSLPREAILALLLGTRVSRSEADQWFG